MIIFFAVFENFFQIELHGKVRKFEVIQIFRILTCRVHGKISRRRDLKNLIEINILEEIKLLDCLDGRSVLRVHSQNTFDDVNGFII